ncbi:hypothetical protein QQX98_008657 [Neonectria punicea]|uniref:CBM-cenC domain-containing protein n=1 Tax=Neonectria punicea TaxID=979145 RepID=A0ABR1GUZ4_9HYPO
MTNGVTYPASRITSACSCIDVPASTVSVTNTVSTETVTQTITSYITSSATITTWTTVSTATTGGGFTVTVGPPASTNRIVNGDFETGNAEGWELVPESWKGALSTWNAVPTLGNWSYLVTGSSQGIGSLRQVLPVYLEAGRYRFGLVSSPLLFPQQTAGWGNSAVLNIANPAKGTNTTVALAGSGVRAVVGRVVAIQFNLLFDIPENVAGYTRVSIRYLTSDPPAATIDGISLRKAE